MQRWDSLWILNLLRMGMLSWVLDWNFDHSGCQRSGMHMATLLLVSELTFDQLGFVQFELPDCQLSDFGTHMVTLLLLSELSFDQLGFVVKSELPDCQLSDFGMHMVTPLLLSELTFDQLGFVQFELPDY